MTLQCKQRQDTGRQQRVAVMDCAEWETEYGMNAGIAMTGTQTERLAWQNENCPTCVQAGQFIKQWIASLLPA